MSYCVARVVHLLRIVISSYTCRKVLRRSNEDITEATLQHVRRRSKVKEDINALTRYKTYDDP